MAGRDEKGGPGPLRRALGYLRSYKRESIGAALALMLVSGASLVAPLLVGRAIDMGIAPRKAEVVAYVVAGLVAVALARGLFTFLQTSGTIKGQHLLPNPSPKAGTVYERLVATPTSHRKRRW